MRLSLHTTPLSNSFKCLFGIRNGNKILFTLLLLFVQFRQEMVVGDYRCKLSEHQKQLRKGYGPSTDPEKRYKLTLNP